ncbi:MAG: deoxyribose-phosphate aldolase [Candidatus Omnitrophica bacterium]|nr:deoxyribose-phosphate aldolase [Candidatus Omnitrophota bacterium]
MAMTLRDIAQMIDHALLAPGMTDQEVVAGCALAARYGVKAVCVKSYSVPLVKKALLKSPTLICAVIGFPHGNSMTSAKLREAQEALAAGAHEIDMVINIGKARSAEWEYVNEEIRLIDRACQRHSAPLKVIFENDFLSDAEIIKLCEIASQLNVAFIKTSTGFGFSRQADGAYNYKGATMAQVALMRQHAAPHIRIKASGNIRTLDDVLKFKDLGCSRIGTSATKNILEEAQRRGL